MTHFSEHITAVKWHVTVYTSTLHVIKICFFYISVNIYSIRPSIIPSCKATIRYTLSKSSVLGVFFGSKCHISFTWIFLSRSWKWRHGHALNSQIISSGQWIIASQNYDSCQMGSKSDDSLPQPVMTPSGPIHRLLCILGPEVLGATGRQGFKCYYSEGAGGIGSNSQFPTQGTKKMGYQQKNTWGKQAVFLNCGANYIE